jgi:hypothetical protein
VPAHKAVEKLWAMVSFIGIKWNYLHIYIFIYIEQHMGVHWLQPRNPTTTSESNIISSWTEVKRHKACSARVPRTGSETWHHLYGPLEWDCSVWTWECCANEIDMSIYIYVICSSSVLIKASNLFQWSSVRISSSVCQPSLINIFTFCLRDTTTVNSLTNLSWPHALRHKK